VITNHLLKKAETASRLHNIAKIAGVDLPIVCINGFKEDEGIWEGEILEALLSQTLESEFERRDEKFVYYKNGEKWLIAHHHIFSQNTIICKVDPKMIFVQQEEVAHNGLICENFNKICPHEKENGNNKDHLIATARKAYKMINNLKENEKIGKDCNKVVLVENQFNLPRAKYVFNYVWNCENTQGKNEISGPPFIVEDPRCERIDNEGHLIINNMAKLCDSESNWEKQLPLFKEMNYKLDFEEEEKVRKEFAGFKDRFINRWDL